MHVDFVVDKSVNGTDFHAARYVSHMNNNSTNVPHPPTSATEVFDRSNQPERYYNLDLSSDVAYELAFD
jgi:hypothetical protein